MYLLYEQLDGVGCWQMAVLLDCIADIKGLPGMDMLEVSRRVKCDGVDYLSGGIVYKLKLYMLQVASDEL